ncbi:MAG: hypothetical protein K2K30_09555 [Alistipes sp.]|nr:hypothetical protein [Alistipes sp.]MDE6624614.1 hypothetical protein [Alistipes sp.]
MKKILNILLGVLLLITFALVGYAMVAGGDQAAISLNLVWGYILFAVAIAAAIGCAVYGMAKNPAGIKGTILSLVLIIVVVGVSYFYAAGHTVNIVDLQNNGVFGHDETVITETSILVTYIAFAAAFVTAIVTEIWGALK